MIGMFLLPISNLESRNLLQSKHIFVSNKLIHSFTMQLQTNPTDNFIVFSIKGGIGKNILATAVVKAIKNQYPDMNIVVLTAYKDVWLYNPNVFRSYNFHEATYFYENFVKGKKNLKIFNSEPYETESYILKKDHLINIWCDLFGIAYNNEKPEIFFNQREVEFIQNNYTRNEPIFVIQTNGGGKSDIKHSWVRDLPIDIAQQVVDKEGEVGREVRAIGDD